jgi:integrase
VGEQQVGRIITAMGRLANVKVNEKTVGEVVKVKHASAHDLRRSFGERWAARVMPQVLMELMRHESMDTTLRYYVGRNAQQTTSVLWDAHKQVKQVSAVNLGVSGQSDQETQNPDSSQVESGS